MAQAIKIDNETMPLISESDGKSLTQSVLYPLRFEPIYQYRLWGGRRLADLLTAPMPSGPIAFDDPGDTGKTMSTSDDDCDEVLANFAEAGINVDALGAHLQTEGAESFVESWNDLLKCIASKSEVLKTSLEDFANKLTIGRI